MSQPLLDAARALGPLVRAHADENERLRRLADPLTRDVHAITQHIMLSDRNLLPIGRLAFGLDADASMF
ncbi:MAG TPA: hypothetical protein VNO26_01910 [Candidatus Limnocylindria bacterium]|nr:hypothetical protein [Candidatus Limnocylindria bacterium]